MKKAKILFTALAVLAVVGGALAFKSTDMSGQRLFLKAPDGKCTLENFDYITTDPINPNIVTSASFTSDSGDCTDLTVTFVGE